MANTNERDAEFNGRNEEKSMQQEFNKERSEEQNKKDDLSLSDSIRNQADVNGTTFGADSNSAKFSNIGDKNQRNSENNNADSNSSYSDYLNKEQDKFIEGDLSNS